jgi:CRISPR-associated protein Csm1
MGNFGIKSPKARDIEVAEIALGALTHDIGKFLERAQPPGQGLSSVSKSMEPTICPVSKGKLANRDVLYTHEFFQKNLNFPKVLDSKRICNLAIYHYKPDTEEKKIISSAKELSSGLERQGEDFSASIRSTRLLSPLSTVFMESSSDWTKSPRLDLAPFSSDATFPKNAPGQIDLSSQYRKLWDQFLKTWRNNQAQTPLDYVNASCAILSHFTWCIPFAVNARPDVSLYDHLLTTAALALAQAWADDGSKPFLLLGGNLNGIEKYILKISAGQGGLAGRLRARSFQIAVYIESVMLEILRRLSLPLTQCLFLAGGKFQLLLPNSQEARDVIKDVSSKATDWLYKQSRAELSLNLAYISSDAKEIKDDFIKLTQKVSDRLRQERNREGASILQNEQGWVTDKFVLSDVMPAPGEGLCQGCGQRPRRKKVYAKFARPRRNLAKNSF